MRKPKIISRRPAETAALVAAIAAIAAGLGVDLSDQEYKLLLGGVGLVSALVTWWKARHGG